MSTNTTYFKPPEGFNVTKEIACGNTKAAMQKKTEMKEFFVECPHWKPFIKLFRRGGWIFVCSKEDPEAGKAAGRQAAEQIEETDPDACSNPGGHEFVSTGTADGGDDERWMGEGRSYCIHCGADGDA